METAARTDVQVAAKLFRGLGDPTRLAILLALAGDEKRVADLIVEVGSSQANVSGHLACLKDCGLVESRADGRQSFYRVAGTDVIDVLRTAEKLLARTGENVDLCSNLQPARRRKG